MNDQKNQSENTASKCEKWNHRTLADITYTPLAKAKDWGIELAAYPYPGGYNPYKVEWPRMDTPLKVLAWVHHLTGKIWFSPDMCRDFLDVVYCHFKWERKMP